MKKFASHRLYVVHLGLLLKNQTIEVDETTGNVIGYYPFIEESCFTEWLNGLIVLSCDTPRISLNHACDSDITSSTLLYVDKDKNIRSILPVGTGNRPLSAFYITSFNVSEMCFSDDSRVVRLC